MTGRRPNPRRAGHADPGPGCPVADAAPGRSSTTSRSGCRFGGPTSPWRPASSSPGCSRSLPAIQRSRERMSAGGLRLQPPAARQEPGPVRVDAPHRILTPAASRRTPTRGLFVALLHDAGVLQDLSILDCPYNGPCSHPTTRPAELRPARGDPPHRPGALPAPALLGLRLQRRLSSRARAGPGPLESRPPMAVPVVADAPSHENYVRILDGNSPNHARRGQNVLYSDGSVRFHPTRRVSPIDQRPLPQQPAPAPARARRARRRAGAELQPDPGVRAVSRDCDCPTSLTRKRRMMKCSFACASGL